MSAEQSRVVSVHGICGKCGYYLSGKLKVPSLLLDDPEESPLPIHEHFTVNCPRCFSLINLVSVRHKPLKKVKRVSSKELAQPKR